MTEMAPVYERREIIRVLEQVRDPEIPVLSISDMGIVKDVLVSQKAVNVEIMPTYSGCPAMDTISDDIKTTLQVNGYENISVTTVLSPAWSSDFISDIGREKLREFGIAPPQKGANKGAIIKEEVFCPQCGSGHTELVSQFGSTACKALYKCQDCLEPFDYFKCV
jgi:ring-1,2-phenylacetyl-CoA epoxidase subunit PaaD